MNADATGPTPLVEEALQALRAGDFRRARSLFERVLALTPNDPLGWIGVAYACAGLRDDPAKLAALDRVLQLQPRNIHALMLKGDHHAAHGDPRTAGVYYRAVKEAVPDPAVAPPDVQQLVVRAHQACDRYAEEFERGLLAALRDAGFDSDRSSPRFTESLEIMFGRAEVRLQRPTRYYFPGLPQIAFYEREQFPWLAGIEAATDAIRAELVQVLQEGGGFVPYLDAGAARVTGHGLVGNPAWGAFYLWKAGAIVPENAARCPNTMAALAAAPLDRIDGCTPSVLFSRLAPRTHIPPHHGMLNTRLICHLPLILPGDCALRVGNDVRPWKMGESLVFDDSVEHEAWNDSDETRVILLYEIWRPELTAEERRLVATTLQVSGGSYQA